MTLRRILLSPITVLIGAVLRFRHWLYDGRILQSTRPSVNTIAVGNLALGGTGKTPHVELILDLLHGELNCATLSRGYGRKGTEFREVMASDAPSISGDEPLQLKNGYSDVRVFVGADRVEGIERILGTAPGTDLVLLDDALQHRRLDARSKILLTTWQRPYTEDALFPAGTLRDLRERASKMDMVIVTKCPPMTVPIEDQWRDRLALPEGKPLFFSTLEHAAPQWVNRPTSGSVPVGPGTAALLFTGIADASPLVAHARSLWETVEHVEFKDHHMFSDTELERLAARYATFGTGPRTLVTTRKDVARIADRSRSGPLAEIPLAVIGVKARIMNRPDEFASLIRTYAAKDRTHR